jgi:hypothetical protein
VLSRACSPFPGGNTNIFFKLNAVRALGIVAFISIFVMTKDIQIVNAFQAGNQTRHTTILLNCDYIESVSNETADVFLAALNRLLIMSQMIMLFLSELGWPVSYFSCFFPVLGPDIGLGPLGIFQCLYAPPFHSAPHAL